MRKLEWLAIDSICGKTPFSFSFPFPDINFCKQAIYRLPAFVPFLACTVFAKKLCIHGSIPGQFIKKGRVLEMFKFPVHFLRSFPTAAKIMLSQAWSECFMFQIWDAARSQTLLSRYFAESVHLLRSPFTNLWIIHQPSSLVEGRIFYFSVEKILHLLAVKPYYAISSMKN